MRNSYQNNKQYWLNLLQRGEITLVCFCSDPVKCHRTILADMLVKVAKTNNINIEYHGERLAVQQKLF